MLNKYKPPYERRWETSHDESDTRWRHDRFEDSDRDRDRGSYNDRRHNRWDNNKRNQSRVQNDLKKNKWRREWDDRDDVWPRHVAKVNRWRDREHEHGRNNKSRNDFSYKYERRDRDDYQWHHGRESRHRDDHQRDNDVSTYTEGRQREQCISTDRVDDDNSLKWTDTVRASPLPTTRNNNNPLQSQHHSNLVVDIVTKSEMKKSKPDVASGRLCIQKATDSSRRDSSPTRRKLSEARREQIERIRITRMSRQPITRRLNPTDLGSNQHADTTEFGDSTFCGRNKGTGSARTRTAYNSSKIRYFRPIAPERREMPAEQSSESEHGRMRLFDFSPLSNQSESDAESVYDEPMLPTYAQDVPTDDAFGSVLELGECVDDSLDRLLRDKPHLQSLFRPSPSVERYNFLSPTLSGTECAATDIESGTSEPTESPPLHVTDGQPDDLELNDLLDWLDKNFTHDDDVTTDCISSQQGFSATAASNPFAHTPTLVAVPLVDEVSVMAARVALLWGEESFANKGISYILPKYWATSEI